nr:unnamed protein product [Spirometra erinaceieuropaei]
MITAAKTKKAAHKSQLSLISNMPTKSNQTCAGSQRTLRARIDLVGHFQTQCTDLPKATAAPTLLPTTMASTLTTVVPNPLASLPSITATAADGNAPDATPNTSTFTITIPTSSDVDSVS